MNQTQVQSQMNTGPTMTEVSVSVSSSDESDDIMELLFGGRIKSSVICDIKYTGIGSNFRTYFCEDEFREIIHRSMPYFCLHSLTQDQLEYFNIALEDPLHCSLDLLLEFTGAYKVKYKFV